MNILFFTHYGGMLGANRSMHSLAVSLQDRLQCNVMIICRERGELLEVLEKSNIPFKVFYFDYWCYKIDKYQQRNALHNLVDTYRAGAVALYQNRYRIKQLEKEVEFFNPTWVISNSATFDFGYLYAKANKIKHLWFFREFGREDYEVELFNPLKVFVAFHKSDVLVAISQSVANHYKKKYCIFRRIHTLYDGVFSVSEIKKIEKSYQKVDNKNLKFTFGLLGVIKQSKGQRQAIEAFSLVREKHPAADLLIVGPGDKTELEELISAYQLDHSVKLIDYVEDPFEILSKLDVNLVCSTNEGLGRTTIEAMAMGIPTIGLNAAGTSEIIQHGFNGLLYQKTTEDLAQQMTYLIQHPDEIVRMGQNAKQTLRKKFMIEEYSQKIYSLLLSK